MARQTIDRIEPELKVTALVDLSCFSFNGTAATDNSRGPMTTQGNPRRRSRRSLKIPTLVLCE